ncbi:MAG: Bax inhibitor-1/YccA family protein [Chloroflexi bacterium]|nr:Bax inhibitor-1/YccA family protein [Chloroflexota bacterium]
MSYESLEPEYQHQEEMLVPISEQKLGEIFTAVMSRVYGWMTLGLLVTTLSSLAVLSVPALFNLFYSNRLVFWGLVIGQFILVIAISRAASKLSSGVALALFFLYAALMGVMLTGIFLLYSLGTIVFAFGITTVIFLLLTVIGLTTKQDLTRWGPILLVGLLGMILASIVNIFFFSEILYWVTTYVLVLIFMGLIVYDSQRIKKMAYAAASEGMPEQQVISSIGVMGALSLYLDFINLFLLLLRIFGRRR